MLLRSVSAQPAATPINAAFMKDGAMDNASASAAASPSRPLPPTIRAAVTTQENSRSVIGLDLTIIGQGLKIVTAGALQIDGQVQGDVQGADVIIGEAGSVTGTVAGETVTVNGTVAGVIRGRQVTLSAKSHVEGDVHHQALSIEPGAEFDGRSRRSRDGETFDLSISGENDQPKPAALR